MEIKGTNGVQPVTPQVKPIQPASTAATVVPAEAPKAKAPVGAVGYPGASQVKAPFRLDAGTEYTGRTFGVQCIGDSPIMLEEVTPKNVDELSKHIDIWYQGGKDAALKAVADGQPDPRFLHPQVGESFQHYGLTPISDQYVTKDPEIIEYARKNGLTALNERGEECFLNGYNGNKRIIEETYTGADGRFLSETGGLKGKMQGTQIKDTRVALLEPGSIVKPLGQENMRIIKEGDVVSCLVKKGKAKNDWFVKPVTEFLQTAKKSAENGELLSALEDYVKRGFQSADWADILKRFR